MIRGYTVAVTTPGTAQGLFPAIQALAGTKLAQLTGALSGPLDMRVKGISFQADPANTAASVLYIGSPDLNVASKIGVMFALGPGVQTFWIEADDLTFSLSELWFDISAGATVKNLFVTIVS